MKHLICGVMLVGTMSTLGAQSAGEQEIRAAEQAWADSYQSCDVAKMDKLLSDDITVIQHTTGASADKPAFMKIVAACSMAKVTNTPTRVRVYGATAAVQGRSTYNMKSAAAPISVVYTRVWIKAGGQWQIVNHQSTGAPVPPQ